MNISVQSKEVLEITVNRYVEHMVKKYNIVAAMVTGSYVNGNMGPRSDIDIFFLSSDESKSIRGTEYFEGVLFEYFISPEWKYYDRLKSDDVSKRIYSSSKILYDTDGILERIQKEAKKEIESYNVILSDQIKCDYTFWLYTIRDDGLDLFEKGKILDFLFFTSTNLKTLGNLLCKINNTLPIYNKYGLTEMKEVDPIFEELLHDFLLADNNSNEKKELWGNLCDYLIHKLGDIDITNYKSEQVLTKK